MREENGGIGLWERRLLAGTRAFVIVMSVVVAGVVGAVALDIWNNGSGMVIVDIGVAVILGLLGVGTVVFSVIVFGPRSPLD